MNNLERIGFLVVFIVVFFLVLWFVSLGELWVYVPLITLMAIGSVYRFRKGMKELKARRHEAR